MRTQNIKKTQCFAVIITSFFVLTTSFLLSGCKEQEARLAYHTTGIIVGYTKCNDSRDNDLIGLFIITENKDSLLSFNVPLSSISIDPDLLHYGAYDLNGKSISFDYRTAVGEEMKQISDFICPQNAMFPAFSHGPIGSYKQIIVTDIKLTTS